MKTMCRRAGLCSTGLGLALLALSGCQTWMAGMTLPSGRYLQHPPQYIPPSPPFPLSRELASQEAAQAAIMAPTGAGALPPAVPPAAVPGAPAPPVAPP
jgi:hypothetical protein